MSYVKNAWYVAAWTQDLEEGKPLAISILGERLVIYRAAGSGRLVAMEDRCVHRLAPLSLGRCEGESLRCMYHGLLFNPEGKVVEIPGQELVPAGARVRTWPVVERHSWIWIWMGDAAHADVDLVPPAIGFDDPDWILGRGHLDYAAAANLINDNLLDFSHLTYVHAASFQAGDVHAYVRPRIAAVARGIRYERWVEGGRPMRPASEGALCDMWSTYDFLIPGVLLMHSAQFAPGSAAASGQGRPLAHLVPQFQTFTSQAVTPMTDRTARYFFSWGPQRDCGDEKVRDGLMQLAGMAFGEDKVMIEAQQKVIDDTADPRVMPTGADKALTLYNRLVEKLAREEAAAPAEAAA